MSVSHQDLFISTANGRFCYRLHGEPGGPPLLLVNGLGSQLINWPDGFLAELLAQGFFVISYDNRDVGLSVNWDEVGPTAAEIVGGVASGTPLPPAYTLADMASDGMVLAEALGHGKVHIFGTSMGGMIVQQMAIDHPHRVASMTSVMSTTGNPEFGQSTPEARAALMRPIPNGREAAIDTMIASAKTWESPEWFDPELARQRLGAAYDRTNGVRTDGTARQFMAITSAGSRDEALAKLEMPVLVIHGTDDTLITPSGAERTAAVIPGAELVMLEGMGHDLPEAYWATIAQHVQKIATR